MCEKKCEDDPDGYKGVGRPACGDCQHGDDHGWGSCESFQTCTLKSGLVLNHSLVLKYDPKCEHFIEKPDWKTTYQEYKKRCLLEKGKTTKIQSGPVQGKLF
jgi:hypothetical protein